eukprot:3510654-Pleurochrysis_carterae.AAC.1
MPTMRCALERAGAARMTFAQCAFGAQVRTYTTLACAGALRRRLEAFDAVRCVHGERGHAEVAHGRDAEGRPRAARTAAYPARMNDALAELLAEEVASEGGGEADAQPGGLGGPVDGGRVRHVAALTRYVTRGQRTCYAARAGQAHAHARRDAEPAVGGTRGAGAQAPGSHPGREAVQLVAGLPRVAAAPARRLRGDAASDGRGARVAGGGAGADAPGDGGARAAGLGGAAD